MVRFHPRRPEQFSGVGTLKESGEAVNLMMRVRFPSFTPNSVGMWCNLVNILALEASESGFESQHPNHRGFF